MNMPKTIKKIFLVMLWLSFGLTFCYTLSAQTPCGETDNLILNWLTNPTTVEEAEAAHMVRADALGPDPVPFGYINADWKALLAEMQEGDELWEFKSPPETWDKDHMAGRKGIALIRNCKVVAAIVTLMN
jgi:hypothetical protein